MKSVKNTENTENTEGTEDFFKAVSSVFNLSQS